MKRAGRKSLAQTPSPKEERIYGSKVNKEGSASSETEAKSISFSDKVMEILKKKQREYNKENPSTKVSIDVLKAVFRRGAGAYSRSHRPTITGGRPNSRTAWAIARVNKFLEKRSGKEVKKAYVQDDDLLKKYQSGGSTQPKDLTQIENYRNIYKGAEFYSFSDNPEKVEKADRWFELFRTNQKERQLTAGEFSEFMELSSELSWEEFSEGGRVIIGKPKVFYTRTYADGTKQEFSVEDYEKNVLPYHLGGDMSKHLAPNGKPSNLNHEQWHLVRTPEFKAWFGDWENDPENASKVVDENGEPLVVYHGTKSFDITEFDLSQSKRKSSGIKEFGFYFTDNKKLAEAYRDWSELKEDEKVWIERQIYQLSELRDSTRNSEDFYNLEEQIRLLQFSKKGKIYGVFLNLKKMHSFDAKKEVNIEAWNNLKVKASYKIASNRDAMDFLKEGKFGVQKVDGIEAKNIVDAFVQTDELKKDLLSNVYLVFDSNNIKLADGSNTTFDPENPDIRFAKGGMTWSEYVKTQFDENEDRYLPSGYLGEFEIKTNDKEKYPILLKVKNDLEYRLRGENSSIIGVFDKNKKVAGADDKVVQVAKSYQKKGIGLELVSILKQRNPNHRFASMTPEGFNLMGRYYDTYIANNPDSKYSEGGVVEVVLNEGNGVAINKLYNEWANIRTEKQQIAWAKKVRETKFGSYGTIGILEVLDKFEFMQSNKVNGVMKHDFIEEVKDALNSYAEGGDVTTNLKELSNVEETANALNPIVNEWKSSIGVKLRNLIGLIAHNGDEVIRKFDPSKIVGQTRGRYGKGFYFSSSFKNFDYGDKSTYLDSTKLSLLNGDISVLQAFSKLRFPEEVDTTLYKLNELLSESKNIREYNEISEEIKRLEEYKISSDKNQIYIQKALEKAIKENPNQDFGSFLESLESRVIEANKLNTAKAVEGLNESFNNLLLQSGFDGISFTQGHEILIVPQEKLNDLIVQSQEKAISQSYHKAKSDGSNPELVKAVEEVLSNRLNTTFNVSNPDIRFDKGGSVEQTPKFGAVEKSKYKGWSEEKVMSYDFPELYEIAEKHHAGYKTIRKEFIKGIFVEREHTSDWGMSAHVSLQHVFENPKYYTILQSLGL